MRKTTRDYLDRVAASGNTFFGRVEMIFFDSRIESEAYLTNDERDAAFIVTSEQFGAAHPRLFSVRYFYRDESGRYRNETVEGFQSHKTAQAAINRVADLMDAMSEGMTHDDILSRS